MYHLSLNFVLWFCEIIFLSLFVNLWEEKSKCEVSLRDFSSVGQHLRSCSRVRYLLKIVKDVWNQKSKRVDCNHSLIVLIERLGLNWISGISNWGLKLKESDIGWVTSNRYKNLVFTFSFQYSFTLYVIVFTLFLYIFAYNCLFHSDNLNLQK